MIWLFLLLAGFAGTFFALGAAWVALQVLAVLLAIAVLLLVLALLLYLFKRLFGAFRTARNN